MRIPMKNDSYICIQTTILLEQRTVADPGFGPGVGGGLRGIKYQCPELYPRIYNIEN